MRSFFRFLYTSSSVWLSAIFFVLTAAALSAHAAPALIRVNQIGYEVGISARAYLMTSPPVRGVSYFLNNSSGVRGAGGTVGPSLGSWGSFTVYPIDFTLPV